MPLYEYECQADGSRFEVIQKFSDPPLTTCPKCGGEVRKLVSSPAIQFKGSGWYITDYARKGSTNSGSSSSGNGKDSSKESSGGGKDSAQASSPSSTPASSSSTGSSSSKS